MLLMTEEQDERIIWVVVEFHRPKGRIRSRIVLHLGQYRDRTEAEAAFAERLTINPTLRECAQRWAASAQDVLTDRKARAKFLMCGVITGIAHYADDMLRRREEEEQQARARARGPLGNETSALRVHRARPSQHRLGQRDQAGLSPQGVATASRQGRRPRGDGPAQCRVRGGVRIRRLAGLIINALEAKTG